MYRALYNIIYIFFFYPGHFESQLELFGCEQRSEEGSVEFVSVFQFPSSFLHSRIRSVYSHTTKQTVRFIQVKI